jgi:hypothetical protein
MADACLYCNKQEDLKVHMTVDIDGVQVSVVMCETHQNNTNMSAIKKAYQKKLKAIEKVKEMAKLLGLNVDEIKKAPAPQAATASVAAQPQAVMQRQEIQKSTADTTAVAVPRSATANVPDDVEAPRGASYAIDGKAPKVFKKKEATFERSSDGMPIRVPERIVSEAGTTNIAVIQGEGDQQLQRRLKDLKAALDRDPNAHIFGRDGYTITDCTFCSGTGRAKIGDQLCPKCKGKGCV